MGVSGCKVNRIRLLSLILAILLTFSAFPVFAAGEEAVWDDQFPPIQATEETEDWSTESISEEAGPLARFFPDYTLEDYADVMYGSGTIKDNGCSVCCMASVDLFFQHRIGSSVNIGRECGKRF